MILTVNTIENSALTKAKLAEDLYIEIGLTKRESKEIVETVYDLITDSLALGNEVKISGFGNFSIRNKSERPGRNPRTGAATTIYARRVVTFHASQKLKDQLL